MAFRSSVKFLFAGAAALLLAACGTMDIDRVRTAQPTGASPFNVALTNEYRELAVYEADKMYDWPDAVRWSQKGLAASNNQLVLPEQLGDWRLPADKLGELTNARLRLVTALDGSARSKLPADAARAQAMFDCWVEQQEENWQHDHIAACRQGFLDAMQKVDEAMAPPKPAAPAPVGTPAPAGPFTVYFAFDSANLSAEALRIVRSAADAARTENAPIGVVGHADAAGPADYNMRLSLRRAQAVRDALIADIGQLPVNAQSLVALANAPQSMRQQLAGALDAEDFAAIDRAVAERRGAVGAEAERQLIAEIAAVPGDESAFVAIDRAAEERALRLLPDQNAARVREAASAQRKKTADALFGPFQQTLARLPATLLPFRKKLFGLSIHPDRLAEVRNERRPNSQYASLKQCLHEVGEAELLLVLEHRAGIHHQAKFRPLLRPAVLPDVVADAVRQRADGHVRVHWQGLSGLPGLPGLRGERQRHGHEQRQGRQGRHQPATTDHVGRPRVGVLPGPFQSVQKRQPTPPALRPAGAGLHIGEMDDFRIDARIERASTPPSRLYHHPGVYALQQERIFARAWQLLPGAERVRAPGHVLPQTLLPGCLDEPVVVTRDQQGTLHCLSNVCTHRGAIIVEGEGHVNTLRCRYHVRRFALDCSFQHRP